MNNENGILDVRSSWFQCFSHPTQILECSPVTPIAPILDRILLKADIPIVVLNPLTTTISLLLKHPLLTRNPNAIILVSSIPSSPAVSQHIHDLLTDSSSPNAGAKVIFVEPHIALRSLSTLTSDPKNARNVQTYQHDYTLSNVSSVNVAIKAILAKFPNKPGMIRTETALTSVRLALEVCRAAIHREEKDLDVVFLRANELRGIMEEAKAKAYAEVLGSKTGEKGEPEVAAAMTLAAKDMKAVTDYLTWWRMLSRVDEIGIIVGNAVRRVWCKDLEAKVSTLLNLTVTEV